MNQAILPIEYLDTHMLCRWRFMLGDNIASEKSVDEVVEDTLKKHDKLRVLTKINESLYLLSEVQVRDGEVQNLHITVDSDDIYGNELLPGDEVQYGISIMGIHAALGALVAGGIEDAKRGKCCTEEYRNYMQNAIRDDYIVYVNGSPYPLFEASEFLFLIIHSVRGKAKRHEPIEFPEFEYATKCNTCPFAEHCDVELGNGDVLWNGDYIRYIVSVAMYLDLKFGNGWYLLYRTALKYASYKNRDLGKALRTAMKELYGEEFELDLNVSGIRQEIKEKEELSDPEFAFLSQNIVELLRGEDVFVEEDILLTSEVIQGLIDKGFFTVTHIKRDFEDDALIRRYFLISPGEKLIKYVWGVQNE